MYDSLTGIVTDDVFNIKVTVELADMATYDVLHTSLNLASQKALKLTTLCMTTQQNQRCDSLFQKQNHS